MAFGEVAYGFLIDVRVLGSGCINHGYKIIYVNYNSTSLIKCVKPFNISRVSNLY